MSRLGDLIRTERMRRGMTPKQAARICGVAERYIVDVEDGRRIIADDQARRILKTIGLKQHTEADFTLDDIAVAVDLQTASPPRPVPPAPSGDTSPAASSPGVDGSIWLDALSAVLKRVPVMNAVMQETGRRFLPVLSGLIEGAPPDKVFYFAAPDDSMRGFRIHRNDLCLIVPSQSPIDGAIMLADRGQSRALRKIKRLDAFTLLLQSFDHELTAETAPLNEIQFAGRCVRVEIEL